MSKFDRALFEKLTHLSKIACSEAELEELYQSLVAVLGYIDHLQAVDTSGVEPTYTVTEGHQMLLREDIPEEPLPQAAYMQNAPAVVAGMIQVPNVLTQGS